MFNLHINYHFWYVISRKVIYSLRLTCLFHLQTSMGIGHSKLNEWRKKLLDVKWFRFCHTQFNFEKQTRIHSMIIFLVSLASFFENNIVSRELSDISLILKQPGNSISELISFKCLWILISNHCVTLKFWEHKSKIHFTFFTRKFIKKHCYL